MSDPSAQPTAAARGAHPPAAPAPPTSLARHYSHYFSANMLGVVAGFVSYPILVRMLTKEQYGVLGYFELFPLIWIAILKLGTQQSIQRFYPVYCAPGGSEAARRRFYASFVLAPMIVSSALCLLGLAGVGLAETLHGIPYASYLFVVLIVGQVEVLRSFIDNTIRARELSAFSARVAIAGRYLQLALVLAVIFFVSRTAMGVFCANIAGGLLILAVLARWARRECPLHAAAFDAALLRESLSFGLPLALSEISLILLAFADRLMIKHYMQGSDQGFGAVGIYTVGYGLAMYVGVMMRDSLAPAFQPVANRRYETEGSGSVRALQRRLLKILLYAAAAFAVGTFFVGGDVLTFVAGRDKTEAIPIFQWVGINYVLLAIFGVAGYGLTLQRRSGVISVTVVVALAVNIVLNVYWIPRYGLMGAVAATLVAYLLMGVLQVAWCGSEFRPTLRVGDVALPLALAAVLAGAAWLAHLHAIPWRLARIAAMGGLCAATFLAPALALDGELREQLRARLPRRWRRERT